MTYAIIKRKQRRNNFTGQSYWPLKIFFLILPICTGIFSQAQRLSKKVNEETAASQTLRITLEFLQLAPGDQIADIGSGAGYALVHIANRCPSCTFDAEDIDSLRCNRATFEQRIRESGNLTSIDHFRFTIGNDSSTTLPGRQFNKVLIFDTIHEISKRDLMLSDIKRILADSGSIYIREILVHRPQKKDRVCSFPFLTEEAFKSLLSRNGLALVKEQICYDDGSNRYIKLFQCRISN